MGLPRGQRYRPRGDGAVGRVNSSRKNRRKLARAGKKQRKLQHQSSPVQHQKSGKLQARKERSTGDKGGSVPTRGVKTEGASSLSSHRKSELSAANERDKQDIAKLEKLLKIDKKKKKGLPNSFHEDGLDCIQHAIQHTCIRAHMHVYAHAYTHVVGMFGEPPSLVGLHLTCLDLLELTDKESAEWELSDDEDTDIDMGMTSYSDLRTPAVQPHPLTIL